MKLAEALTVIQKAPESTTPYRVLMACGFSPLHLQTFLNAHLQAALNRRIQLDSGLYGSLTDTVEKLPAFGGDSVALFIEWPDLDARLGYRSLGGWGNNSIAGVMASVENTLSRLALAIQNRHAGLRMVVSLPSLALPPAFHTVNWQWSAAEISLENAISEFAGKLSGVLVVNRQQLAMKSPLSERYDFRPDLNAGFPYSIKHADILAEAVAGLLRLRPAKKGLISDLDDTMWRGLVGEVGPDEVSWNLASHAQLHGLYQQMLQALAEQGVLIGIASKNNAETAQKAINRPDFLIQRDRIYPLEIHWEAKSISVERILKAWNIGAESVVFVDDNLLELDEVRQAHPSIECIHFAKNDHASVFALLNRLRDLFGKPALSNEDGLRMESVRKNQVFAESLNSEELAEQFLSSLEAVVTVEWPVAPSDARTLELVNKTNQFNLNGRRFTEAEWIRQSSDLGSFIAAISYQDKFGPLGKIAVISGQQDGGNIKIETWVMSCRAFSRRIEYQTLKQVFEKTNATQVEFAFRQTDKNGPIANFLKDLMNDQCVLTQEAFADKCAPLYHQVTFIGKDRESSWTTQKSD